MHAQLNGKTYTATVAPGTHYGESTFSLVVPAPATIGTYPLGVLFTPLPGSSTGGGSATMAIVVSNFSGTANAGLTISGAQNSTTGVRHGPRRNPQHVHVAAASAPCIQKRGCLRLGPLHAGLACLLRVQQPC